MYRTFQQCSAFLVDSELAGDDIKIFGQKGACEIF